MFRDEETKTNADREMIDSLLHGNLELTVPLAQEIYYKIKLYDIEFQSMLGLDFLDSLTEILTEDQMRRIRKQATSVKRKENHRQKLPWQRRRHWKRNRQHLLWKKCSLRY